MGPDGSIPLGLARTRLDGYSLFNLEAMAAICQIPFTNVMDDGSRPEYLDVWSTLPADLAVE